MAKDILMPQMGFDMTEGTVVRWVKKVGDRVHRGDVVAEIETDKATVEVEAFANGTLLRITAQAGQTVAVGAPIATLGEPGERLSEISDPGPAPAKTTAAAPARPTPPGPPAPTLAAVPTQATPAPTFSPRAARGAGERTLASPLARRLASQLGVDLASVRASGPDGRIVAADVEAAGSAAPAPAAEPTPTAPETAAAPPALPPPPLGATDTEPSRLRLAVARSMSQSKRDTPHFYVAVECQADALMRLRQELGSSGIKVSLNDLLVKALATAAADHPGVNTAYLGGVIRSFANIDVGIAIATEQGLLSPAVRDVGNKSIEELAKATRDLAERARAGRLRADEYGGGTITLSNLGMYGVDEFMAIINPTQALIVAVGAATERVIALKGKPAVATVFTAWAAADHRVLDGATVGAFMATFRAIVEEPARLAG